MEIERIGKRRKLAKPRVILLKSLGISGNDDDQLAGNTDSNQLPEWLLFEILCKLPMKSVYKFKCVSKQCLSFISHPFFFKTYLSRWPPLPCPLVFLSSRVNLAENPKPFPFPPPDQKLPEFHKFSLSTPLIDSGAVVNIKAADKGFLLLGREVVRVRRWVQRPEDYDTFEYFICNAMTNQCFAVPKARRAFNTEYRMSFIARAENSILISYRIVAIHSPTEEPTIDIHSPPEERTIFRVHLFASETGRWTRLKVPCDLPFSLSDRKLMKPVIANNALHWMYPPRRSSEQRIIVYQPYIDPYKFFIIEVPADSREERVRVTEAPAIGVSQGRLKYFKVMGSARYAGSDLHLCIWELQQDSKWCLQHTIRIGDISSSRSSSGSSSLFIRVELVAFHPYDPDVVFLYFHTNEALVSYNVRTKEVEHEGDVGKFDLQYTKERVLYLCLPFIPKLPWNLGPKRLQNYFQSKKL